MLIKLLAYSLTIAAIASRFWLIHEPQVVVFDEVHFGKFASYYLRNEFFFDVHPPLGKLLLALVGWIFGYDGHFLFEEIGLDYKKNAVPYLPLRAWCAICGVLLCPLGFLTMKEAGYSLWSSILVALLLIFDNAMVAESRFILLDSMLAIFIAYAFYAYIRFYKLRHKPFTISWWSWLILTGISMTCAASVKLVGLFTVATIGIAVLIDLWQKLDIRSGLSMRTWINHFKARFFALIIIPVLLYLAIFYVHFALLYKSGPGDAFMDPEFQSTLEGNRIAASTLDLVYGDVVLMLHRDTASYLHSHIHRYPLNHEDGKVSSQGQQVTGYKHRNDVNNLWRILPSSPSKIKHIFPRIGTCEPRVKSRLSHPTSSIWSRKNYVSVKNNEEIRLEHVVTGTVLRTHDVASPLTRTNTEFTTADKDDKDAFSDTIFKFEILNPTPGGKLVAKHSHVQLVHVPLNVAMSTHREAILPKWGFQQLEINGNKKLKDPVFNTWTLELEDESLFDQEVTPVKLPNVTFLQKFVRIQAEMLSQNNALTKPHPFQSHPSQWPLSLTGISFWTSQGKQIFLIGNLFGWWLVIFAVLGFTAILFAAMLLRQRGLEPFEEIVGKRLKNSASFMLLAYFLHYLPFYLMGRQLFLHHYLPALYFGYLVVGVMFDFCLMNGVNWPASSSSYQVTSKMSGFYVVVLWLMVIAAHVGTFVYFSPITYGHRALSNEQLSSMKWINGWDIVLFK